MRSEYALPSLIYLARQPEALNTSAVIGTSQQIPCEILREI
jgi:DNA-binding IscR family transcriptional regulator